MHAQALRSSEANAVWPARRIAGGPFRESSMKKNVNLILNILVYFVVALPAAGLIRYFIDDFSEVRLLLNSLAIVGGMVCGFLAQKVLFKGD
jgi:putative flippase GtrA